MNKLVSAVVLQWPNGYTADLRFEDKKDDITLSSDDYYLIHWHIEKYMRMRPQ